MGYSHYFPQSRSFTDAEWLDITSHVNKVVALKKSIIGDATGNPGSMPSVNAKRIVFNGIGEMAHDTFSVTKSHDSSFNFCKTAQKPYDDVVVAVLCIIIALAPGALKVSSDGYSNDWKWGLDLAKEIMPDLLILPSDYTQGTRH